MKNNDVEGVHLGGGVVLFEGALSWIWKSGIELAESLVQKEVNDMYTLAVNPANGKKEYLNRSGFFFDTETVDSMPKRASRIHENTDSDIVEFFSFLEEARDSYLLKYLEMFPLAFKTIWWKVKGHIVSYAPGVYLGAHSDVSVDYEYGVEHPKDQLATRNTVTSLIYFNDSVDDGDVQSILEFGGGHHYFNYLDITVVPKKGDLLMFPANFMAAHEVLPTTGGVRYSYLGWYAHGTPNDEVGEQVVDPIENYEAAKVSTNVYMPNLKKDFVDFVMRRNSRVSIPGFDFGEQ